MTFFNVIAIRLSTVDIYQSANVQGADATADDVIRRWKQRIKGF